jgi:hypothetical protein
VLQQKKERKHVAVCDVWRFSALKLDDGQRGARLNHLEQVLYRKPWYLYLRRQPVVVALGSFVLWRHPDEVPISQVASP